MSDRPTHARLCIILAQLQPRVEFNIAGLSEQALKRKNGSRGAAVGAPGLVQEVRWLGASHGPP